MTALRPAQVVHRGSVETAGFAFSFLQLTAAEVRARVLASWQPGCRLLELSEHTWLLALPDDVRLRINAAAAPGGVLTRTARKHLTAAPLTAAESRAFDASSPLVFWVEAGVLRQRELASCPTLEPERWLELSGWQVMELESLRVAAADVPVPPAAAERDLRALLGARVPPPTAAPPGLLADVSDEAATPAKGVQLTAAKPRSLWTMLRELIKPRWYERATAGALSRLLSSLSWLVGQRRPAKGATGNGAPVAATPQKLSPPTAAATPHPVLEWFRDRLQMMLFASRLSKLVGRRHARYLRDLVDMFERGDLDAALRHAIPFNQSGQLRKLRLALSSPKPREHLTLTAQAGAAPATITPLGDSLYDRMLAYYAAAAQKLVKERRIAEAAFVYAELLGNVAAAVALLEEHGQLREAAELAEGRELDPMRVVRQWVLAGDSARAASVAQRHNAFAGAIALLEPAHAAAAATLRGAWSQALERTGNFSAAIDAIWPLRRDPQRVLGLLQQALRAGGAQTGRALAQWLAIDANAFERVRSVLDADDGGIADASERMLLLRTCGHALLAESPTPALRAAAAVVARGLLTTAGRAQDQSDLQRLLDYAQARALKADLPPLKLHGQPLLCDRREPLELQLPAAEPGLLEIYDAAPAPHGGLIVALGDAGVRIYSAQGRCVARFEQPATSLVINPNRTRAIGLCTRGGLQQLTRLDLLRKRAQAWCLAEIAVYAATFYDSRWFVASRGSLLALDVAAEDYRALWRSDGVETDAGCEIRKLHCSEDKLEVVLAAFDHPYWQYDTTPLRLRQRGLCEWPSVPEDSESLGGGLQPGTRRWLCVTRNVDTSLVSMRLGSNVLDLGAYNLAALDASSVQVAVNAEVAAIAVDAIDGGTEVFLVVLSNLKLVLHFVERTGVELSLRLSDHELVLRDNAGHVRMISLQDGRLLQDLTVRV